MNNFGHFCLLGIKIYFFPVRIRFFLIKVTYAGNGIQLKYKVNFICLCFIILIQIDSRNHFFSQEFY